MKEHKLLNIASGNFNSAIASGNTEYAKILSDICINLNLTFKQSNTLRAMVGYMY
jgi:hypothetical protein